MSRIAEMTTSAELIGVKVVKSSETERKERMDTSSLMEQILSSDNLNRAYLQVVRNKGAEGVDGMKYTELKEHLAKNGEIIKEQLRTRKYKPQPVRRVEIPKPDGGVRNLGVPTVTDRFIQQAIDYYPLPEIYPWVSCVFVSEEYRGLRISGKLIDFANAYLKEQGFTRSYIPTPVENVGLYERYGYSFVKEIVNYAGCEDLLYSKEIK